MNIYNKGTFFKYFYLTISLLISAIGFNVFVRSFNIVSGGTGGVAIIFEHLFGIDSAVSIFILSIILAIISFIFLGYKESIAGLYIAVVYPIFVYITAFLIDYVNLEDNILIAIVFGGIIRGIAVGMNYQTGFNAGGFGIIAKIISNKFNVSESLITFIINLIIICCGALIFGIDMVLYAVIFIYITAIISNKVFIGISKNKLFYIISDKEKDIIDFSINELGHDITMHDVKGEFLNKNKKLLMVVVPTKEYFVFKNAIKEIDSKAFVFVSDSYETKMQDVSINN